MPWERRVWWGERMRTGIFAVAVLVAALLAPVALSAPASAQAPAEPASRWPGSFTRHTQAAEDANHSRDYWLYVPAALPAGPVPLIVFLHGCTQTAEDVAIGTGWNELAEREGVIVVYPEQRDPNADEQPDHVSGGNGGRCWNWFRPEHIHRGSGEPGTIAAITETVAAAHPVDRSRIHVLGISAGGFMSSILGAAYPDVYASIGIVAGCGYPCGDTTGQVAAAEMGERARQMPVFVLHGTADGLAAYPMGVGAVQQWLGTADLADDGQPNGSVSRQPAHRQDPQEPPGAAPGGDPCLRNANFPCPGGAAGAQAYPTTIERFDDAQGCELVQFWTLHGLSHNYPGGNPEGTFTDPSGPSATEAAWAFFARHPMGACARQTAEAPPAQKAEPSRPQPPDERATGPTPATGANAAPALAVLALALAIRTARNGLSGARP